MKCNLKIYLSILCFLALVISSKAQTNLSLTECLKQSALNNLSYRAQGYDINAAQADQLSATLRPNLYLNNQNLFITNSKNFVERGSPLLVKNAQIWLQLTKVMRISGERGKRLAVTDAAVVMNRKNLEESKRQLYYVTSNQWLDIWFSLSSIDLLKKARHNVDTLIRVNQLRLKNQVITVSENLRTEILAAQYQLQIQDLQQQYFGQIEQLRTYMGSTADSLSINQEDSFTPVTINQITLDSLEAFAFENRTDLQTARSQKEMYEANIKLQKSLALPPIEAGVIYNPQNGIGYAGTYLTIPIPVLNKNQGEIQKSHVQKDQADVTIEAIKAQIRAEVRGAFEAYRVKKINLDLSTQIISKSEKVLSTVQYSYLRGGTSIIDYLDAQRTWFSTQQMYFDVLYKYRKSYVDLIYTTGLITQIQ